MIVGGLSGRRRGMIRKEIEEERRECDVYCRKLVMMKNGRE